jgi:hypothetical protein
LLPRVVVIHTSLRQVLKVGLYKSKAPDEAAILCQVIYCRATSNDTSINILTECARECAREVQKSACYERLKLSLLRRSDN